MENWCEKDDDDIEIKGFLKMYSSFINNLHKNNEILLMLCTERCHVWRNPDFQGKKYT